MRAFPLGLIGPALLAISVTGAAIWAKDGFQPMSPLPVVELDPAAMGAAKTLKPAETGVVAAPARVETTPSAPVVAPPTTEQTPPTPEPSMSAAERNQLLREYEAHYRERFRLPELGQEVVLRFRTGATRTGKFQRVNGDRIEVLLNGAALSFPRGELTPKTQARFYEDNYAKFMAHKRLMAK